VHQYSLLSLSDANTERVTIRAGYPNPMQPVERNGKHKERIPPSMRSLNRPWPLTPGAVGSGCGLNVEDGA